MEMPASKEAEHGSTHTHDRIRLRDAARRGVQLDGISRLVGRLRHVDLRDLATVMAMFGSDCR